MKQIEGFNLAKGKYFVCKLRKALYGLKQAPRVWYAKHDHYIQQQGFRRGVAGSNVYMNIYKNGLLITLLYIDDLILSNKINEMHLEFAQDLSKDFEMLIIG